MGGYLGRQIPVFALFTWYDIICESTLVGSFMVHMGHIFVIFWLFVGRYLFFNYLPGDIICKSTLVGSLKYLWDIFCIF